MKRNYIFLSLGCVCMFLGENAAIAAQRTIKRTPSSVLIYDEASKEEKKVPEIDKEKLFKEMERVLKQRTAELPETTESMFSKHIDYSPTETIPEYRWLRLASELGTRNFHGYEVVDISHRSLVDCANRNGLGEYVQQIQAHDADAFKEHILAEGIVSIESLGTTYDFINEMNAAIDAVIKNTTGRHLFEKFLILKKLDEKKNPLAHQNIFKTITIKQGQESNNVSREGVIHIQMKRLPSDKVLLGNFDEIKLRYDDTLLHELAHQFHYSIGKGRKRNYSGFLYSMLSNPYVAERFNPFLNPQFFREFAMQLNQKCDSGEIERSYLDEIVSKYKDKYAISIEFLKDIGYGAEFADLSDSNATIGAKIATIYSVIFCYCWSNDEEALTITGAAPCCYLDRSTWKLVNVLITDDQNESIYQTRGYDLRRLLHYTNFFANNTVLKIIEELMRKHKLFWTPENENMTQFNPTEETFAIPEEAFKEKIYLLMNKGTKNPKKHKDEILKALERDDYEITSVFLKWAIENGDEQTYKPLISQALEKDDFEISEYFLSTVIKNCDEQTSKHIVSLYWKQFFKKDHSKGIEKDFRRTIELVQLENLRWNEKPPAIYNEFQAAALKFAEYAPYSIGEVFCSDHFYLEPDEENLLGITHGLLKFNINEQQMRMSNFSKNLAKFMEEAVDKSLTTIDNVMTVYLDLNKKYPSTDLIREYFLHSFQKINLTNWLSSVRNDETNLDFIASLLSWKLVIVDNPLEQLAFFDEKFPDHSDRLTYSLFGQYVRIEGSEVTDEILQRVIQLARNERYNWLIPDYLKKYSEQHSEADLDSVDISSIKFDEFLFEHWLDSEAPITAFVLEEAVRTQNDDTIRKCIAGYLRNLAQRPYKEGSLKPLFTALEKISHKFTWKDSSDDLNKILNKLKESAQYGDPELQLIKLITDANCVRDSLILDVLFYMLQLRENEQVKNIIREKANGLFEDIVSFYDCFVENDSDEESDDDIIKITEREEENKEEEDEDSPDLTEENLNAILEEALRKKDPTGLKKYLKVEETEK